MRIRNDDEKPVTVGEFSGVVWRVRRMIVQACLNGARPVGFHPGLPIDANAIAADGARCVAAGAAELHVHSRGSDGRESLACADATVRALRDMCPGTLIGVSTGAWIENDEDRTRKSIAAWSELPDYASVNLSEPDAPAILDLLRRRGIGIEAGLASAEDAERFVRLCADQRVFRVLIEIGEQNLELARRAVDEITSVLARAEVRRPILLHGFDETVWPLVELARERRWSTRIGLEDGKWLADGGTALGNAALVAAAVEIFRNAAVR